MRSLPPRGERSVNEKSVRHRSSDHGCLLGTRSTRQRINGITRPLPGNSCADGSRPLLAGWRRAVAAHWPLPASNYAVRRSLGNYRIAVLQVSTRQIRCAILATCRLAYDIRSGTAETHSWKDRITTISALASLHSGRVGRCSLGMKARGSRRERLRVVRHVLHACYPLAT
jgi:hypothetical protein